MATMIVLLSQTNWSVLCSSLILMILKALNLMMRPIRRSQNHFQTTIMSHRFDQRAPQFQDSI